MFCPRVRCCQSAAQADKPEPFLFDFPAVICVRHIVAAMALIKLLISLPSNVHAAIAMTATSGRQNQSKVSHSLFAVWSAPMT
jgi:hypothetical protein